MDNQWPVQIRRSWQAKQIDPLNAPIRHERRALQRVSDQLPRAGQPPKMLGDLAESVETCRKVFGFVVRPPPVGRCERYEAIDSIDPAMPTMLDGAIVLQPMTPDISFAQQ